VLVEHAKTAPQGEAVPIKFDRYHEGANRTRRHKNKSVRQTAFSVENYVDYLAGCAGKIPVSPLVIFLRFLLRELNPYLSMPNLASVGSSSPNPGCGPASPFFNAFHNRL
jgi:hypothetical protein